MNSLYLESNPSSGGQKAHHPAGFEPITARSWGMCSTTEPQPPPYLHIQLLHQLFHLGNKSKLFVSESRTLERKFKRGFMLHWNSRPLIGWNWSRDFYQPMRTLKFLRSVNLCRNFLYRIGSRKVTQWSCRVSLKPSLNWKRIFLLFFKKKMKIVTFVLRPPAVSCK